MTGTGRRVDARAEAVRAQFKQLHLARSRSR
jgi:hypothetical protein